MAAVLQVASANGQVHRVPLEEAPTYESVDRLLRGLCPGSGAGRARYTDEEGDWCQLNPATFTDFLETGRLPNGGGRFLRLEMMAPVPPGKRARTSAAREDGKTFPETSDGETSGSWQVLEAVSAGRSKASWSDLGAWKHFAKATEPDGEPDSSESSFEPVPMDITNLRTDDWTSSEEEAPDEDLQAAQPPPPPAAPGKAQEALARLRRAKARAKGNPNAVVHMGHVCDGCEADGREPGPLQGPRFTCRVCEDYDLCESCFRRQRRFHDATHRFQQVVWSEEVAPTCPRGCGFGVTSLHAACCCRPCAEGSGKHSAKCLRDNLDEDDL